VRRPPPLSRLAPAVGELVTCNRYRLTAKQAEIAVTFGIRPPYEPDETYPPADIFPTGKKTPFYGQVVVQDGADRKLVRME